MMRLVGLLAAAWLAVGTAGLCADLALQPYSYHEGFEGDMPPVAQWAKNGPSTVNFLGVSEERAFEGKRSLKLDVSLEGGSYHYWGLPVHVPCAGKLKLSARVFVAPGTTARVGFGTNQIFPPTGHSGCGPNREWGGPTADWQLVEADLVADARDRADSVLSSYTATVRGEDVGPYLDRWAIFIYGGEGQRAIVYVDDVRIEGEVPSEADYSRDAGERFAASRARLQERLTGWREQIAEARKALEQMAPLPEVLRGDAAMVTAAADRADKIIATVDKSGYADRAQIGDIEAAIAIVKYGPETLTAILQARSAGQPYLIYTPRAITNERLTPDVFPIPARVGTELSIAGCRGEYEPATFAVYALSEVKQLSVSCTDLTGPAGTIPASAVDIRVVKVWYQAGRQIWDLRNKTLAPELLLKDDALVRVDMDAQENYLRSTAEDGAQTYLLCSGKTSENLTDVRPVDAELLQPVDIAEKGLKQFWLTVLIPPDAAPGDYEGQVALTTPAGTRTLPLRLHVHAFELLPSRLTYSIYYRAHLSPDGRPTISSEAKSEEQYRAEIADLKAHGVLYPTNYHGWDERLARILEIRREEGLPTERFFNLGRGTGSPRTEAELQRLRDDVKQWVAFCQGYGYDEVFFYGIDEATGDQLKAQQDAWRAVQEAGGKTFVACYKKTFETMGALLNCAVLAGRPDPEEGRKWHSVGSQAFCYAYPQVGNEEPQTYRRNFGLVLWKAGFDGAMDYAYQHGFNHVWNDFDDTTYRDHNFTYPTLNGVVDTIQWEGFREAVDDVRYVTTLERAIAEAPVGKAELARAAREWLEALDPDLADLYATRERMVEWIVRLGR